MTEAEWEDRCTDCDDTGITIQTERPCSCAAGDQHRSQPGVLDRLLADIVRLGDMPIPVSAADLEALYRILGHEWSVDDDREIDAMALEALCRAAQPRQRDEQS